MSNERTFAIIKPDAVKARTAGRILAKIEEAGFTVRGMRLVHLSKRHKNVAVMIGYELGLSKRLKQAADCWLNNPRVPREAAP